MRQVYVKLNNMADQGTLYDPGTHKGQQLCIIAPVRRTQRLNIDATNFPLSCLIRRAYIDKGHP